jgi:alpha-beta hydrolase superfamily lysophospholipase
MLEQTISITSFDGTRLHLHAWEVTEPRLFVVVAHGLGGHAGYYRESLAPYLNREGYAVYAPDLRGHGHSDGIRGDIDDFGALPKDLGAAVAWARARNPHIPFVLLAESMGTSIAINYAADAQGALKPDALALVACVIAPTVKPRLDEIFRTPFYAVTNRRKIAIPITGREEQGVRDPAFVQILKTDPLFNKRISVRFLLQMTATMRRAATLHNALTMPVLLMQGGKDITVRFKPTFAFFDKIAAQDKEKHVFPQAFHAILNDPDSPQVRAKLIEWLGRMAQKINAEKYTLAEVEK